MRPRISEESFEYYVLDTLLAELGYEILRGEDVAPGEPAAEREDFGGWCCQDARRLLMNYPAFQIVSNSATRPGWMWG